MVLAPPYTKRLVLRRAPADTELHSRVRAHQGVSRRTWRRTQPAPGLFPQRHAGAHAAALRCPRRPLALCASFHRINPTTLRLFFHAARAPLRPHSPSPRRFSACTSPHAAPRAPTRRRSSAHSSAQSFVPAAAASRHAPFPLRAPRRARASVYSRTLLSASLALLLFGVLPQRWLARSSPSLRARPRPSCAPTHTLTPRRAPPRQCFGACITVRNTAPPRA